MKTYTLITLLILAGCSLAKAQSEHYVTITAIPVQPSSNATNTFTLTGAESAELISLSTYGSYLSILKDGVTFTYYRAADNNPGGRGSVIQGPATFTLLSQGSTPAYLTLKVMPESFSPNKTLILPPGTNQFQVTLQTSTNLVNWNDTTNGVYGSPDSARFFRVSMSQLPSP